TPQMLGLRVLLGTVKSNLQQEFESAQLVRTAQEIHLVNRFLPRVRSNLKNREFQGLLIQAFPPNGLPSSRPTKVEPATVPVGDVTGPCNARTRLSTRSCAGMRRSMPEVGTNLG